MTESPSTRPTDFASVLQTVQRVECGLGAERFFTANREMCGALAVFDRITFKAHEFVVHEPNRLSPRAHGIAENSALQMPFHVGMWNAGPLWVRSWLAVTISP